MIRMLYNSWTWFWHKILRRPIKLAKVYDNKVYRPILTVVFLHGISATSDTWRVTLREFNKSKELQGVRLVALDLLGFGRSLKADWLEYTEEEYNAALDCSLKKLSNNNAMVLVGHSMGSLIAADYAVDYENPVELKHLILVSPPVLMADDLAKLPDRVYTKSYASLHKIAQEVPAAETVAKLVQRFSSFRSDYIKTAAFEKSMDNIILNKKNYQTYVKIHLPTTIIHGHFDPLVIGANLKRAVRRNPRYLKYVSVIGQHDISAGKRAKILLEIKKVLKEVEKDETV